MRERQNVGEGGQKDGNKRCRASGSATSLKSPKPVIVPLTCDLRRRSTHLAHKARRVDHASTDMQPFTLVGRILSHRLDRVLATIPHALDVDLLRQVPHFFIGRQSVVVRAMHDPGVVEHDVQPSKLLHRAIHAALDVSLGRHIAFDGDRTDVRVSLRDQVGRLLSRFSVQVGQDDVRSFRGKEERGLETDTGSGAGDDGDLEEAQRRFAVGR